MRVYIAAPWVDRALVPAAVAQLEEAGHTITERWWEHPDVPGAPSDVENSELDRQAVADFEGVVNADAVVVLNTSKSEGKAVEQGIALTMCIPVILIGSRSNIFHYMPSVVRVKTVADAIEALRA